MNRDQVSTLAGGSAGLLLLNSVRWEQVPYGELVKIVTAFALIVAGYMLYHNQTNV